MSHESIDLPPTLRELTAFPTKSHGKVNIPEQIGVKYTEFGVQLLEDSTGARVSNMVNKHREDPQRINTEILQEWLQNEHGERPVSWRTLVEVLRDIKLGELARDIEEACLVGKITVKSSGQRYWSLNLWRNRRKLFVAAVLVYFIVILGLIGALTGNTVTQSIENLTTGVAMSTTIQSPILEYAKVLNDKYQMQRITDPSHWLQVGMPFINLTLMESNTSEWTIQRSIESQLHGRYQLSLDEVVDSVKKGSKLLMEGRPGVGKTTMLRHIAKKWAEGKLLQSFQLVILIRLGHIPSSRISTLESLLEYLSHDYPDTASVARELGRTGGEGICFLLDALDEYSPQSPTHSDYIYQLIRGDKLPNAALMVTSRPSASYTLQQEFIRKIQVVGFLQQQIQQYINALPADCATAISDYMDQHTNVKHISYLPLHLAMMTYLMRHSEKVSLLDLDTETRLYHMFVNLTFRQRYKDMESLDKVHSQVFSALSKAAFDATTRVCNSETSLRLHNLDPELRAKVESFSILTIDKQPEGDKVGEIFAFSHYTFQEFFAAYYLTTLPHKEQMQALDLYYLSSQLMWRFFFGLLRTHHSKTTTKLFEKFAHIHKVFNEDNSAVLLSAYELKQTAIADVLVQALNHSIKLVMSMNNPSECPAIGYALSLNSHQFKRITISGFEIHSSEHEDYWRRCLASIAKLPKSDGVVQVILYDLTISTKTISALAQFLRCFPNLQQLEMGKLDVGILKEAVKFGRELEQLQNLRLLSIDTLHYHSLKGPEGYLNLAEILKHLTSLQTLWLTVHMTGVAVLAENLKHLTSLQTLSLTIGILGGEECCDRGTAKLAEGIKHLTSLQTLSLSIRILEQKIGERYCEIGDRSAAKLAEGIKHLTSLETLSLAWNGEECDWVVALIEGVKGLASLKTLDLSLNGVGNRSAAKLAEGIKHLTSLETFNLVGNGRLGFEAGVRNSKIEIISYYRIEGRDVAKLVEGFKHLTPLKMGWNKIGYDGTVALTGGIKNLTSLKTLDLSYNMIGSGSAVKLVEGIKHLTSLETLNLAWNEIGNDGIVALTGGLKSLTSLKTLDLSYNMIGGGGTEKLVEGIKHLTSLETLNLARNRITDNGVVALTGGLKSLTSLKMLDLSYNMIGGGSTAKLAEGIKHLISLEALNLAGNTIGNDGAVALIGGVKNLTSLKTLDLDHNNVEGRVVEVIKHLTSLELHGLHTNRTGFSSNWKSQEPKKKPCTLDTRMYYDPFIIPYVVKKYRTHEQWLSMVHTLFT